MAREDAVFALKGDEVGDGAHRGEIEIVAQFDAEGRWIVLRTQAFEQPVHQFEDEADGAEVVPCGVAGGGVYVGVDQDAVFEVFFLGAVVIDHDDVDAEGAQVGDLLVGVGAAIQRDEQVGPAGLQGAVDGTARQSVAILGAAGNDEARVGAKAAEHAHEERGAADAVDVVVTEHGDVFALGERAAEADGGGLDVGEEKRVLQVAEGRSQE